VGDIEAMHTALRPLYDMSPEISRLARYLAQRLEDFDIEAVRDLLNIELPSNINTGIMVPDSHE